MLSHRLQYLAGLTLLALAYIFSNHSWLGLALLGGMMTPLVSLVWLWVSRRRLTLELQDVSTDPRQPAFRLLALNRGRIPGRISCTLQLENVLSGFRRREVWSLATQPQVNNQLTLTISQAGTGLVRTGLVEARLSDLLGLFRLRLPLPPPIDLFVYPWLRPVALDETGYSAGFGEGSLYSQTKAGPDVNELFALHEYVAGDDLRRVHWKLSGKTDTLMVREFGLPLDRPVVLLLALDKQMTAPWLSAGLDTAVSLSEALLRQGIGHNLCWPDAFGELVVAEIQDETDLEDQLPGLLSTPAGSSILAVEWFCQWNGDAKRRLYYIGAPIEPTRLEQLTEFCDLKIVPLTQEHQEIIV